MKNSKIEWCHHTVNFWWGCVMAVLKDGSLSEACRNCYAKMIAGIFSKGKATWGKKGNRWVRHEAARRELYRLDKAARKRKVRERIFINSMSDTFEDREDLNDARQFLWDACGWVAGGNLDLLLLTKRPENVRRMVPPSWLENWPAHVWIGTTVEHQQAVDERLPELCDIPAKVRFLSCEPLLGPVDIEDYLEDQLDGGYVLGSAPIHWVICGGESGPNARPMHPDWATGLRDQCAAAGVPFFFKQWGEWFPGSADDGFLFDERHGEIDVGEKRFAVHAFPSEKEFVPGLGVEIDVVQEMGRIGKKAAGRILDGKEHSAFPEVKRA